MKIEKINENQIRFFLNETDLVERNIKISELAYGSEKTQDLFRDIMDEALREHGFFVDNTPLIIEAVPIALDSIMVIVTKVDGEDSESKLNAIVQSRELRKFKRKPVSALPSGDTGGDNILIYSFETLGNSASVCARLSDYYEGDSLLYKLDEKYFLVMENDLDHEHAASLEMVLNEYGEKHISTELSKHFLMEHGELLIKTQAVDTLAKHLA